MINKLRFRFIRITMIAILVVLTLIITTINIVNIRRNNQTLDTITQRLTKNQLSILNQQSENTKPFFDFTGFNFGKSFFFQNEKELPYTIRFFSILTDGNKELVSYNLRQIVSVDETNLENIKEEILQKQKSVGWYHSYRYRVSEIDDGYLLIVLEASSTLSSMMYVLFLTLVVGTISVLLLFITITVFSKRAIQPIVDAYDKQKQFITDASHELKTPLTVISANTEILSLSYGENEWCDGIARQTNNMRELIGQMIQMAKLDEQDIVTETDYFNLSDAVYDTCMSFQSPALQRGLKLTIDVGPSIRYFGNEGSIRQVIAILMDNAIKYCDEEGQISVALHFSGKKRSAKLTVSNTCSEIDTLDIRHVFDRFYRHNKARESSNSFGLGLSIAKSIMEQHKGNLTCCKGAEKQILFTATFKK